MAFQKIAILPSFSLNDPRLHHLDCTTMLLLHFCCYQKYKQTVKFALTEMTLKNQHRLQAFKPLPQDPRGQVYSWIAVKAYFTFALVATVLSKESCQFHGKLNHPGVGVEGWRFPAAFIKANRCSARVQPGCPSHQLLQHHRRCIASGPWKKHAPESLSTLQSDY